MTETWGPVRRCLPSQRAGSPVPARLQTGAVASAGGRSAAAPWTAGTEQPGALGAEGSRGGRRVWLATCGPCGRLTVQGAHLTKEPLTAHEPGIWVPSRLGVSTAGLGHTYFSQEIGKPFKAWTYKGPDYLDQVPGDWLLTPLLPLLLQHSASCFCVSQPDKM